MQRCACPTARPTAHVLPQRLVDRLKRERFRAIFDYLRRGSPAPVLNLLETVQVGGAAAAATAACGVAHRRNELPRSCHGCLPHVRVCSR